MTHIIRALGVSLLLLATPAFAQGTKLVFGGMRADTSQVVEVTADELQVDQTTGAAIFTGNVVVGQGQMRLQAAQIRVEYSNGEKREIKRLHASGGVILVSGEDAAEAAEAIYTIESGVVEMSGNVLLAQGENAISGEKFVVNLKTGNGTMSGRVRTILNPGGN